MTTSLDNLGVVFNSGTQTAVRQTSVMGTSSIGGGYYRFPNGLLMQWGTHTGDTGGGTANFPTAFAACLNAYATNINGRGTVEAVRFTNSNITVGFGGSANYGPLCTQFKWFAIGY